MALLQISEPGQSPEPHRHRLAVGIDLGTTNSLVAAVRNGIAVVLNDHEGRALLPSIVRYLGDGGVAAAGRSEEHTSELQSLAYLVCRLLLEKKKINNSTLFFYSFNLVQPS